MKKVTVTIGIPAYNEEKNIVSLLRDILAQKAEYYILEKIIVASDKSTDNTENVVKNIKSKKLFLLTSAKREGQAARQNQIITKSKSDILVLLNADVRIQDPSFLKKIIAPIRVSKADLTSCETVPLPANGFLENILHTSIKVKKSMFEAYERGNNIYTCHGRARAFSKRLYEKIQFKTSVGEDAFSYLFCIVNNFVYRYVPTTQVYYRLPTTMRDHQRQSIRFLQTRKVLAKYFGDDVTASTYKLPLLLIVKSFMRVLIKEPVNVIGFTFIFGLMKLASLFTDFSKNTWSVSQSSKVLLHK